MDQQRGQIVDCSIFFLFELESEKGKKKTFTVEKIEHAKENLVAILRSHENL